MKLSKLKPSAGCKSSVIEIMGYKTGQKPTLVSIRQPTRNTALLKLTAVFKYLYSSYNGKTGKTKNKLLK